MDDTWISGLISRSQYVESVSPVHSTEASQQSNAVILPVSASDAQKSPVKRPSFFENLVPEVRPRSSSWHNIRRYELPTLSDSEGPQSRRRLSTLGFDLETQSNEFSLNEIQDEMFDAGHEKYERYQEQLELSQNQLDTLLESTKSSLSLLTSLSESFKVVEEQTNAFHAQCQTVLEEQKRLTRIADQVKENLQYYAYLDPITRRLNAPGATSVVTRSDFSEMLTNLDTCLDYMQGHPEQLEAASYRSRYKLLLTRALTLIRVHFTETLQSLAADVSRRIIDKQLSQTTQSALLYAKFRVAAPDLRDLGLEILKRAIPSAEAQNEGEAEYQSLMNELYGSYSSTRGRLIFPLISKTLHEMAAVETSAHDLVTFARSAIGFARSICADEYNLWCELFVVDVAVYDFLENLCEPLIDHLRPRTIHETKLVKLCELCTFLQTSFIESDDEEDMLIESNMNGKHGRQFDFAQLIRPALADAQTRLVFLALGVLRNEIEYFKPTVEDLKYPKRPDVTRTNGDKVSHSVLSGRRDSEKADKKTTIGAMSKTEELSDEVDGETSYLMSNLNKTGAAWYPTLPKAVKLLSRIYRLVNSVVFDDLAHRIVHSTTESIVSASIQIASKTTTTDANLFLISQLLQLKQQIVAFDIEFVSPEITFDFSSLTNTFYELRERGSLWNPASWYKLAAAGLLPSVVENMLDAKVDLDGRLRVAINDLVNSFASQVIAPLAEIPSVNPENVIDPKRAATAVRGLIEKNVPLYRAKIADYLEDERTRQTLLAAVRDQVILAYEDWLDVQTQVKGNSMSVKPSRKGKSREDELWSSRIFAEWCNDAFGNTRLLNDSDDNDTRIDMNDDRTFDSLIEA